MKRKLRILVAEGKTDQVLKELLTAAEKLEEEELKEEILLQNARYEEYAKSKRQGTTSGEEQRLLLARINQALVQLIGQLPEGKPAALNESSSGRERQPFGKREWWKWLLGVSVLITIIAGIFQIGGINLMMLFGKYSDSNKGSESLTVYVHHKDSRNKAILQGIGKVEITYGEKKARESINEKGQAIFNEIPKHFFGETAEVYINVRETNGEPYRALYPDSLYRLTPDVPIYLPVILEGLDRIFGIVAWEESPLEGVVVAVGTLRDTTDATGYYELLIPEAEQRQVQEARFFKPGFKMTTKKAYPQTGEPLNVVMSK